MNVERTTEVERRVAVHAALADATRLAIVDILSASDASSSELSTALGTPTNLLAHHVKVLERAGLVARHRSEGDGRRTYLRLNPVAVEAMGAPGLVAPSRVVFVCTANSARSHLAAALWAQASDIPSTSAGTHPADRVDPRAVAVARRHALPLLPDAAPRLLDQVEQPGDFVVTVCDRAHEELGATPPPALGTKRGTQLHWSIPDPVPVGSPAAFDAAYDALAARVAALAPRLPTAS